MLLLSKCLYSTFIWLDKAILDDGVFLFFFVILKMYPCPLARFVFEKKSEKNLIIAVFYYNKAFS